MSGPPLPAGRPMHETNPELRLAEAFVEETDCPVFLTGKAGTGKTTFLQELAGRTGKRLIVTAPNAARVAVHLAVQEKRPVC